MPRSVKSEPYTIHTDGDRCTFKVHGFWSRDYVQINKTINYATNERGDDSISWSCSGRDTAEEESDIIAVDCLAKALAKAVEMCYKSDTKGKENA